jgi:hypothetical protein
MKNALRLIASLASLSVAVPAHATGGFQCRTSGAKPILVSIGFGHAPGAPLLRDATRLTDSGRSIPVTAPQWWFDQSELRLLLSDPSAMRREAIIKARRNGRTYDGSLWRGGRRHWVRCREG